MGTANTKRMVIGAMIAAIFGALSLFNTYTGSMFDIFICYVMVVPIAWYGYVYDIKSNTIVCIVSMIVIAMMGLPFFVLSSFSSCLAGVFIGEALKRKAKKETIILGTLICTLLNNILIYEVFAGLLDMNLVSEMTLTYQEIQNFMPSLSQTLSLEAFLSFIPLMLIMMSVMEMYIIILFCQIVFVRLKMDFPGSFHIANMHLHKKTGMILLILMLGSYLLMNVVGINQIYLSYAYSLSTLTLGLQGLAFSNYYLIMKQKPKLTILTYIAIFIPMLNSVYVVLGILDIFSDLRQNLLYNKTNQ